MTYDQFNSFIETCNKNGITHIILEFILFGSKYTLPDGKWDTIETSDTFNLWTKFTTDEKEFLIGKLKLNNITLMASFGGETSFGKNGFQYTWQNPNSKYYIGPRNFNSIEDSATALGIDLANLLINNNIAGLDFDIEMIPTISSYTSTYSDIYKYLGFMSQAAKAKGITTVSHAPQTPYFYPQTSGSWPQLYYNLEKEFGQYIDFYNIQYYNNGDYSSQDALFTNDTKFQASVNQLITANSVTGLNKIPANKIVLGQAVDASWPGSIQQNWENLGIYVKNQQNSLNLNLLEWYNTGGVMAWLYILDTNQDPQTNQYLLTYFNTLKH